MRLHVQVMATALLAAVSSCTTDVPLTDCDAGCACRSDSDCTTQNPRCDRSSGVCVPCLIVNDNCPAGLTCVATGGSYACRLVCQTDNDCPPNDAGVGLSCCGSSCIDTTGDPQHCGSCDKTCPTIGNSIVGCSAGACKLNGCDPGFGNCDRQPANGCEADLTQDSNNCGTCGARCLTGPRSVGGCLSSACTFACTPPYLDCDNDHMNGCEIDPRSDANNCGGCGAVCPPIPNGTGACQGGACVTLSCNANFADCDKDPANGCEVDLRVSGMNCGACGTTCAAANGTPACQGGQCRIAACDAGWSDCDGVMGNGCETNTASDVNACGGCHSPCAPVSASPSCQGGKCLIASCNAGFADCDGNPNNGCEVNIGDDAFNCAGCGKICPNVANGFAGCQQGVCDVRACNFGFGDCNVNPMDGCETDLHGAGNCGMCGNACPALPHATAGCGNGSVCGIGMCVAGWSDCDGSAVNGCERGTSADAMNCGACNKVCVTPHATPACANGVCTVGACSNGFSDCNGNAADGCEVTSATDILNCGMCGNVCPVPANGSPNCVMGVCGASCKFGFADCDKNPANGCERNLGNDVGACGACGIVCGAVANGVAGCSNGICGVGMCNGGFGNCDGNAGNGCERNIAADVANCGGCAMACATPNATPACLNSQCGISACFNGFSDCDKKVGNGCEIATATDASNCGACGNVCGAPANGSAICANGLCGATCNIGFADCDKLAGDGCEANVQTDVGNCGGCAVVCANVANGTRGCKVGVCGIASCNNLYGDCNNNPADGCEKNLATDTGNCGKCGAACSFPNGVPACLNGQCGLVGCQAGHADCDGSQMNGCEVSIGTDANNCGQCGMVCPMNAPACQNGACAACVTTVYDLKNISDLDGMVDHCVSGGTYPYDNGTSDGLIYGCHWTDTGAGMAQTVKVEMVTGVNCNNGLVRTVELNNGNNTNLTLTGGNCACAPAVSAVEVTTFNNPAGYQIGGVNHFSVINPSASEGVVKSAAIGTDYFRVTVTTCK